jgi:hypothetical protein
VATFHGGPLNGQSYPDATAANVAASFNEVYKPDRYEKQADGDYYWSGFAGVGPVAIPHKADALGAIRKLQHVLARDVPNNVKRSRRARARLRRISR